MRINVTRIIPILLVCSHLFARNYSTAFTTPENPISQGNSWHNGADDGIDWCNVQTGAGYAWGVGPCPAKYADPTAILRGAWGPNQTVEATARIGTTSASYYQEIELRLRTTVRAHYISGYEVNFGVSHAYLEIVRWNGPVADFTYLGSSCKFPPRVWKSNWFHDTRRRRGQSDYIRRHDKRICQWGPQGHCHR